MKGFLLVWIGVGLGMFLWVMADAENREDMCFRGKWNARGLVPYAIFVMTCWPLLLLPEGDE